MWARVMTGHCSRQLRVERDGPRRSCWRLDLGFGPKATRIAGRPICRDGSGATVSGCSKCTLFDHLVGAHKDRLRKCKTKLFRRFLVDHHLKFGWLFNRQIARSCALKNHINVIRDTPLKSGQTRPVGYETPRIHKLP